MITTNIRDYILEQLNKGVSLIIDRYCYSGVAYSMSNGFEKKWCKASDSGLPQPDIVFFMEIQPEEAQKRGEYGQEIYERLDFQNKVFENFKGLKEDYWVMIQANSSPEDISSEIHRYVEELIHAHSSKHIEINKLWS